MNKTELAEFYHWNSDYAKLFIDLPGFDELGSRKSYADLVCSFTKIILPVRVGIQHQLGAGLVLSAVALLPTFVISVLVYPNISAS